jgi:hypothetical protein
MVQGAELSLSRARARSRVRCRELGEGIHDQKNRQNLGTLTLYGLARVVGQVHWEFFYFIQRILESDPGALACAGESGALTRSPRAVQALMSTHVPIDVKVF